MEKTNEESTESAEFTDAEKIRAIAKDLVELAIQTQKVLSVSAIPYSAIEEARLLAIMTNQILNEYTNRKEGNEK